MAQSLAILVLTGAVGKSVNATIRAVATGALELLVLFGVLNDPTDGVGF